MKKRALIVGINYIGTSSKLKGCLNDAENMRVMLESRGFTEIKSVLEREATTEGIKAGLEWLVTGVEPGDVIVFHYSGHGSQLPSSVEDDKWEEIICPIDLNWMDKVITDDTLRQIFDKVPNGVNTTLVLDCCHSGTMLDQNQTLNNAKPATSTPKKEKGSRYLKPPSKIAKLVAKGELVDWTTSRDVNATALLIAACHENQTSADTVIDGQPQGAATAALLKATSENSPISYRSLVTSMQDFMVDNKYKQVPQLDGSERLYDQIFLEPFNIAIPPSKSEIESGKDGKDSIFDKPNMKLLAITAVVVAIALAIIFI